MGSKGRYPYPSDRPFAPMLLPIPKFARMSTVYGVRRIQFHNNVHDISLSRGIA